jgi:hypothetical protein
VGGGGGGGEVHFKDGVIRGCDRALQAFMTPEMENGINALGRYEISSFGRWLTETRFERLMWARRRRVGRMRMRMRMAEIGDDIEIERFRQREYQITSWKMCVGKDMKEHCESASVALRASRRERAGG